MVGKETKAELEELQPQLKAASWVNELKFEMVQKLKGKYMAGPICPFLDLCN